MRGLIFATILTAGVLYLLLALGSAPAPVKPAEQQSVAAVQPGSEGQLQNGKTLIPVAVDEELLPELSRTATASDYSNALSKLSGRVFFVDAATSVRVSETDTNGIRVRILIGPEKGRLGWVPGDWIRPI
jgi:hypothetical protein